MEADVCESVLLAMAAWYRARQLGRDAHVQTERQTRLKLLRAERRLRLKQLHEAWRHRETRNKQFRLHRYCKHEHWMKAITHQFLRDTMRRRPKVWFYPRTSDWWESTASDFTDHQWLQHFRVSRETFSYLCRMLKLHLKRQDTTYRLCIPLQKRVALALYKLANPCDYKTVAELFAVGVASVCRCVHEFCTAVIEVLKPELVVTPSHSDLTEMAEHFYQTYGIPQCIGILDSFHVPIIRPPHYQSDPSNREGYLAIFLQVVVDGRGMFWDLNVGCPRWVNDSGRLPLSWASDDFPGRMQDICGADGGHFILGDPGCPSQNWLLKPYPNTGWLTAEQELFNTQISQAHCVAQHACDRLKGRWKCLTKRNDCNVEVVKDMLETCCVLHNLCERNMDVFLPEWIGHEQQQLVNGTPQRDGEEADSWLTLQQLIGDHVQ